MQDIFADRFQPKRIIDNPSEEKLKEWALEQGGIITEFGNLSVVTAVRHRIAKFTEVVMGELRQEDVQLVDRVLEYLKTKEMIKLDRVMCHTPGFKRNCCVYVTADYPRIPLMWGNTLFPAEGASLTLLPLLLLNGQKRRPLFSLRRA